jgi:PEP-CTERM motif
MKRLTLSLLACVSGLSGLNGTPAQAQEYEITVSGMTSGATNDYNDVFGTGSSIGNGTSFVATYLVEPGTATTGVGQVTYYGSIVGASLAMGGNAAVSYPVGDPSSYVYDLYSGGAQFEVYDTNSASPATYIGTPVNAFASPPTSNPFTTGNPFTLGTYSVTGEGTFQYAAAAGNIEAGLILNSVSISTVPLPSSLWMALAGLGMLGWSMRYRHDVRPARATCSR